MKMSAYRESGPVSILVAAFNGRLFGVEPSTGRLLWEHGLDGAVIATSLVVTHNAIYAATGTKLSCVRYPAGDLAWSVRTHAQGRGTLLLDGERLFLAKAGEIECFSLTGVSLWHNEFKGKGASDVALGVPGNVAQADATG
jgi:outer membrane protein assembly factor BamB